MILKLYTLFIGLLLALFVGVGIAAFFPGPKAPEYPAKLSTPVTDGAKESDEARDLRLKYEADQKSYDEAAKDYNRQVSMVTLGAAVLLLFIGLVLLKHVELWADGLSLGAVFTLIYSIIRGFATEDTKFRFLVVTAGLVVALVLGYIKFVQPLQAGTKRKKA